jgi:hypothetical protein
MRRGGYLFLPGFFSMYDAIHEWMTGWMDACMDGWKASRKTTTTSFTICNYMLVASPLYSFLLVGFNNWHTLKIRFHKLIIGC